jgi:transcriptional regulator GlxA family with amidase domain
MRGVTGAHMSEAMMAALLLHQPHTYSTSLKQPPAAIVPRHVRRAEEFMRANLDRRISFAQVAEAAGVSLRALQNGFQQFRGTSPSAALRAMRLEAAKRDLLSGAVPSVTAVALKWGFSHLGRFAIAYGAMFGSSPSDDLRRARGGFARND